MHNTGTEAWISAVAHNSPPPIKAARNVITVCMPQLPIPLQLCRSMQNPYMGTKYCIIRFTVFTVSSKIYTHTSQLAIHQTAGHGGPCGTRRDCHY